MSEHEPGQASRGEDWSVRREGPRAWVIVLGALVLLLVVFVLQNTDPVDVDFIAWDVSVPLWVLVAAAAAAGVVLGWILARVRSARRARRLSSRGP